MAPWENAYPRKVHPLFNFLNESFGSVSEDRQMVSRNMDPDIDLPNTIALVIGIPQDGTPNLLMLGGLKP